METDFIEEPALVNSDHENDDEMVKDLYSIRISKFRFVFSSSHITMWRSVNMIN